MSITSTLNYHPDQFDEDELAQLRSYESPACTELRAIIRTVPTSTLISTLVQPSKEFFVAIASHLDTSDPVYHERSIIAIGAACLIVADELDRRIPAEGR